MTHKDIYIKFMIEYDKANVTSSYPSLTEYEVATVLDKAYNALIAQKVTGNNVRRSTFESDIKSIADLAPLTKTDNLLISPNTEVASNVSSTSVPNEMLYFLQANMSYLLSNNSTNLSEYRKYADASGNVINIDAGGEYGDGKHPFDREIRRKLPVKLVNHEIAQKFFSSAFNMPWIKEPVCYLEDGKIYVVYDPLDVPLISGNLDVVYIKKPNKFVKDLDKITEKYDSNTYTVTFFDIRTKDGSDVSVAKDDEDYQFECNDTVAEELISLAIAFALENIESTRLNAKLNMRGLEA